MRKQILLGLLFFFLSINTLSAQGKKYAFLLGIAEYYPSSNLTDLKSVDNDLFYMRFVLESQGFECVVLNANGLSKPTIFKQINKALLDKVGPSDLALFYYTGHGTQVLDLDEDECSDNLDEAIVLSHFNQTNPNAKQYILDDEINEILTPIRSKLGEDGQMILIFDACHSGSFSRGVAETDNRLNAYDSKEEIDQIDFSFTPCKQNKDTKKLANLIGLYSSSDAAKSFEFGEGDKKFGVFTYALLERLRFCDSDYTYLDWIRQIELFMSDKFSAVQRPSSEGNLNQLIWQNGVVEYPFPQGGFVKNSNRNVIISPDITLTRGGKLVVYPKGTIDTSGVEPIAIIEREKLYVRDDGNIFLDSLYDGVVSDSDLFFIDNNGSQVSKTTIFFEDSYEEDVYASFKALLLDNNYIQLVDNKKDASLNFRVSKKRANKTLEMLTASGEVLLKKKSYDRYSPDLLHKYFQKRIISFSNIDKIERLDLKSDIDVEFTFEKLNELGLSIESNPKTFEVGDFMDIRIKNPNSTSVFVYLYYLDQSYTIEQLLPKKVKLLPGESTGLESICEFAAPVGQEKILLVVSSNAINYNYYFPGIEFSDSIMDYIFSRLSSNKPILYDLDGILDAGTCSIRSIEILVND
ncbi:MAG: caspase family protein [Saprospiraceae bacterium]|nr:caspase family protein [Saprospiraceae bacterium]